MPWTLYAVPTGRRADLDAALRDDLVSRQSQKLRDAAALGGPSDRLYVLIEGTAEGVRRADDLLREVGEPLSAADRERLFAQFKAEEESASAGMGLFFTEE